LARSLRGPYDWPVRRDDGGPGAFVQIVVVGAMLIGAALVASRWALPMDLESAAALALFGTVVVLTFVNTEVVLYLVLLSMLFSPERGFGGGPLPESRMLVMRTEDILLAVVALGWLARIALNKDLGLVIRTPLNRPILAYLLSALVATLVGYLSGTVETSAGFFYVLKYVEYFVVYYMVANNLGDRRQAWRLVVAAFLVAATVSVIGAAQIPSGARVSAPFEGEAGEPNTFGGYLLLMMALAAGLALESSRTGVRVGSLALLALMVPSFLFTLSRASYLGVLPALGVLAALSRRRAVFTVLPAAGLGLLVIGAPLVGTLVPSAVVNRIWSTFQPEPEQPVVKLGDVALDPSSSERVIDMQRALDGWQQRPLFGWGVTGFAFVDGQYTRILVETGLVGLMAFLWLLASVVVSSVKTLRMLGDADDRGLVLGFLAGTAGLLTHAIATNTFIIVRIMEPYWFFAAVVISLPRLEAHETRVDA
jgi:O-antigen ligase